MRKRISRSGGSPTTTGLSSYFLKSLLASSLSLSLVSPANADSSTSLSSSITSSSSSLSSSPTLQPQTVALPSLNLNDLGTIGIVGAFDAISQYSYVGQQNFAQPPKNPYYDNIIAQLNNNQFLNQAQTNGLINSACSLNDSIYFSGNFTTLQVDNQNLHPDPLPFGFAYINTTSGEVTQPSSDNYPNGTINTLYCDSQSNSVIAGGSFTFNDTTGVAVWDITNSQWKSPLFGGFAEHSIIDSITQYNDSLVFGGSFSALNASNKFSTDLNLTTSKEQQVSFKLAQVDAQGTAPGSDPTSILCPSSGSSGWALTDNRQGTWQATLPFSFSPTRLRLYNLNDPINGVKTWRFLAFPLNGIMNLTYIDPTSGKQEICDAWCPLPQHVTADFLDFEFVNVIEMDSFQIYLLDNYGSFSGLDGVELFQNSMFTYANNTFNEPLSCQDVTLTGGSSLTGSDWVSSSGTGTTYYLVNTITDASQLNDVSVNFMPNITYAANFTVHLFTPGCTNDGTCSTRSGVNVTVFPSKNADPVTTILYETNQFDKYDTVFEGILDARGGFQPRVVITPYVTNSQNFPLTFVAEKVQFVPNGNSTDNSTEAVNLQLNGLFEYNEHNFTKYLSNLSFVPVGETLINQIGANLSDNAVVTSILTLNETDTVVIAGNFSSKFGNNLIAIANNSIQNIPGSGLNGPVGSLLNASDITLGGIIVTGNFTGLTNSSSTSGLNHVALYDSVKNKWQSLGNGFDGPVRDVVNYDLNGTSTYAFSGDFSHASNNSVDGFAIWVPTESAWLQQSSLNESFVDGRLSAGILTGEDNSNFYFGGLRILGSRAPSAVFLNPDLSVSPMPFTFLENSNSSGNFSSLSKRAIIQTNEGNIINTGAIANDTLSILGGHFTASSIQGGDNIQHVLMLNGDNAYGLPNDTNNFLDSDSEVFALLVSDNRLYIGGSVSGNIEGGSVGGLVFYDIDNSSYSNPQPPPLSGDQAIVTSLNMRPNSPQLVVMGSFTQAGSLECEAFCVYDLSATRWISPAPGLTGLVSSAVFIGNDIILFAGAFQLNNTDVYFGQYDFTNGSFGFEPQLQEGLPGPVNSFVLNGIGAESIFASGVNNATGKTYLSHWNNSDWTSLDSVFGPDTTITQLSLTQLNNNHKSNNILPDSELLLVTGNLVLPNFGNVSAAMFDGNSWQPLLVTSHQQSSGMINAFFSQSSQSFSTLLGKHYMKKGFVVLVSLAIAVGLTCLIVLLGLLLAYIRRRKQGYQPAPTRVSELDMTETVPPETLFKEMDNLGGQPRY